MQYAVYEQYALYEHCAVYMDIFPVSEPQMSYLICTKGTYKKQTNKSEGSKEPCYTTGAIWEKFGIGLMPQCKTHRNEWMLISSAPILADE